MLDGQSYEDYVWTSQEVIDWAIYLNPEAEGTSMPVVPLAATFCTLCF